MSYPTTRNNIESEYSTANIRHFFHLFHLLSVCRYAPFLSLSKKTSVFDDLMGMTPAPGLYELELPFQMIKPKSSHTATFGKSKADRFAAKSNNVPGPGAYALPSRFSDSNHLADGKSAVIPKGLVNPSSLVPELEKEEGEEERNKIHWARKFIPPSIPSGSFKVGYDIDNDGKLKVRKSAAEEKAQAMDVNLMRGFVEESKMYDRGTSFSKSRSNRGSLFRSDTTPGPGTFEKVIRNILI